LVSGTLRLRENVSDNTVRTSVETENIVGKNISGRTIMMVVLWLDISPSFAAPSRSERQYECFFAEDVIKPGDEHSFSANAKRESAELLDPGTVPRQPQASVRVVYVQFDDGSEFGQDGFATRLFTLRRITWQNLSRLDRAYERGGEELFLEELARPVDPQEVNTFVESIRDTQRRLGTPSAVAQVHKGLRFAEERKGLFKGPMGPP